MFNIFVLFYFVGEKKTKACFKKENGNNMHTGVGHLLNADRHGRRGAQLEDD